MPKLKTKKALAKRVKLTANKKALRNKAGRRHLLSGKNSKRKRCLKKKQTASAASKELLKRSLPYQ